MYRTPEEIDNNKYLTGVQLTLTTDNLNDVLVRIMIAVQGVLLGFKGSDIITDCYVNNITGEEKMSKSEVKRKLSLPDFTSLHEKHITLSHLGECLIHYCE